MCNIPLPNESTLHIKLNASHTCNRDHKSWFELVGRKAELGLPLVVGWHHGCFVSKYIVIENRDKHLSDETLMHVYPIFYVTAVLDHKQTSFLNIETIHGIVRRLFSFGIKDSVSHSVATFQRTAFIMPNKSWCLCCDSSTSQRASINQEPLLWWRALKAENIENIVKSKHAIFNRNQASSLHLPGSGRYVSRSEPTPILRLYQASKPMRDIKC